MSEPMPPSAVDWNNLLNVTGLIAIAALAVVMGAMVYFTIKYRERKGQKLILEPGASQSRARDAVVFAAISIIILASLSVASYRLTPNARFEPTSSNLVIDVTAFQWAFKFTYPNGAGNIGTINVPANSTIEFNVTSLDVMHNFYLVEYRVSIDAIPGRYNLIWIQTPPLDGNSQLNYTIRCKELCGAGHYEMSANMVVMDPSAFSTWLGNQTATVPTPTPPSNSTSNMGG